MIKELTCFCLEYFYDEPIFQRIEHPTPFIKQETR